MEKMKIGRDNFVWLIVNPLSVRKIFDAGNFELYELQENDMETLIETKAQLENVLSYGCDIGIQVGFIKITLTS